MTNECAMTEGDNPRVPLITSPRRKILNKDPSVDLHTHLGYWEGRGLTDLSQIIAYSGDAGLKQNVEDMIAANCKSGPATTACST